MRDTARKRNTMKRNTSGKTISPLKKVVDVEGKDKKDKINNDIVISIPKKR